MASDAFIAEIDEDLRIVSVWYAGKKTPARLARSEDVTPETLGVASFHGASPDRIKAWLKQLNHQPALGLS